MTATQLLIILLCIGIGIVAGRFIPKKGSGESIFKSNRDFDSTLIVLGIHAVLGAILYAEIFTDADMNGLSGTVLTIYGMIASYFFKSKSEATKEGA